MAAHTRYPGYDVLKEAEAWDEHTREIVRNRLGPRPPLALLSKGEESVLIRVAAVLVDDDDPDIGAFVASETDSRLRSPIGEAQRKIGIPAAADLVRRGLSALEATSWERFKGGFKDLPIEQCQTLLGQVQRGELPDSGPWQGLPQKEFFRKTLEFVVETYYSHPRVWSEIGHGGPAYPRGYVRSELDVLDPWEAGHATREY